MLIPGKKQNLSSRLAIVILPIMQLIQEAKPCFKKFFLPLIQQSLEDLLIQKTFRN